MKKLTRESLLNCRFRCTTLPHEELLNALENIIIDKVTTHSAPKVKKNDTSALMEIGMATGADGEETFEEGYGKAPEIAVQAVYRGKGPSQSVQKYVNIGEGEKSKSCWKGTVVHDPRQERTGERWQTWKLGHTAATCVKGSWN